MRKGECNEGRREGEREREKIGGKKGVEGKDGPDYSEPNL